MYIASAGSLCEDPGGGAPGFSRDLSILFLEDLHNKCADYQYTSPYQAPITTATQIPPTRMISPE